MGTFEEYRKLRRDLETACDQLEEVWEVAIERTEFETTAGASLPDTEIGDLLSEVRRRLASDTVEVGIFGQVKRGKSTLINALVGQQVSSVNVVPETATPVWVESGEKRSYVIFSDGHREEFADAAEAAEMATQRHKRRKSPHGNVLRVQQYLEIDWLPQGLRLVDTPGLSDPSLIQDYEDRTLGELERVAAAVFVIVAPPGADREEVQLLKSLGRRGIDKVFIVCNFWSDLWSDVADKQKILDYVKDIVVEGAMEAQGNKPREVHLYGVNAKMAVRANDANDLQRYEESGVAALRRDIEDFLTNGALVGMTVAAAQRLDQARAIAVSTLRSRRKILANPSILDSAVREKELAVSSSQREIESIEREVAAAGAVLESRLVDILSQPYDAALGDLSRAATVDDAKSVEQSLQLRAETAATKASVEFDGIASKTARDAEKRLYASFGAEGTFASPAAADFKSALARSTSLGSSTLAKVDWGAVAASSVAAGAGTGIIGGTLAGGLGTALIASGPVGWIIGAGIGLALGLAGGALAGGGLSYGKLKPSEREKIAGHLKEGRENARVFARGVAERWTRAAVDGLNSKRDRYLADKDRELARVKSIVADEASRRKALERIDHLLEKIL